MLSRDGRKCVNLTLPVNYRCDQAIIANAQRWVPEIEGQSHAIGTVEEIMFSAALERANNDGKDIELPDGIKGKARTLPVPGKGCSFAFLCRVNVPLVVTAYQLIAKQKRVQIIGRNQIGQPLIDLIYALCGTDASDDGYTNRISNRMDGAARIVEEGLMSRLEKYLMMQRAKLTQDGQENILENLEQNVECIQVVAANTMDDRVSTIINQIMTLFVEEPDPNTIQLSTVHRSKGLEWEVIFILRPDLLPHPRATQPEELEQEENACYVAATRAKHRCYYIGNWPFGNGSKLSEWEGLPDQKRLQVSPMGVAKKEFDVPGDVKIINQHADTETSTDKVGTSEGKSSYKNTDKKPVYPNRKSVSVKPEIPPVSDAPIIDDERPF
jgi:ATP-dependent exoDNAse (exonuclease V) beta subunit